MKRILGLDLGTNSIGWALIQTDTENSKGKIDDLGVRIIPMDQAEQSDYERGNTVSKTAERTRYRGIRRIRERQLLRRERLHRILNIISYLPDHYKNSIDFEKNPGKFKPSLEPKIAYRKLENSGYEFLFKQSYNEMIKDFNNHHSNLLENGKLIPYDWTIFYLRKKALLQAITKEELAWVLLNFNQKRGYCQLRDEEVETDNKKSVEYYALKVTKIEAEKESRFEKDDIWYHVTLENGWVYKRSSKIPLEWEGKVKEFIVTTDLDQNGEPKRDKDGNIKRSFRMPKEDDWTLLKKRTEIDIENSGKRVGEYIYDNILNSPEQKIRGKLIRTIERKFYKEELKQILQTQKKFHPELNDVNLLEKCAEHLYPNNNVHARLVAGKSFEYLLIDDLLFYQRPLKSKKSDIENCRFEFYKILDKDKKITFVPVKGIAKSHPLFQEFRLWKFIKNLRLFQRELMIDSKIYTDYDITNRHLNSESDITSLFQWLYNKKSISQKELLGYFKLKVEENRWNYVEDRIYPSNETRGQILSRLNRITEVPDDFLNYERERHLWHILYSIENSTELKSALEKYAEKNGLPAQFVKEFEKFPSFKKEYGSFSEKAIKKLLPLVKTGKFWSINEISDQTLQRIHKIIDGEVDPKIAMRVREKCFNLKQLQDFKYLPEWLATYVVYNRHSEDEEQVFWKNPADIDLYLKTQFKQHSLGNPVVEQLVTESLRVVSDLWKYHGNSRSHFFDEIHIELGRELKNSKSERERISSINSANENTNLRLKALLLEMMNDPQYSNVRPNSPSQLEILKLYEEGALASALELPDDIIKITSNSNPSKNDLIRYKLWLEQRYRSPYTGEIIPLSKLFTSAYEIEHIIPQSRFFDDSLSNKVICEAEVNKDKGKYLAYEYILKKGGEILELAFGKKVKLFSPEEYISFVKESYKLRNVATKKRKLLMDEIPETFIQRQLNDTKYISKIVRNLLSNVVREQDELEPISKNIISVIGSITDKLKNEWGLNDVWNSIVKDRFIRLNNLTNTEDFGSWVVKDGKRIFQTNVPLAMQKGFSKKRIDHRHHALDALVIACCTRNHINFLNNQAANSENKRYELRNLLCDKIFTDNQGFYIWRFKKPWENINLSALEYLDNTIVSFKQNLRIINRTVNRSLRWKSDENNNVSKERVLQTIGDHWAIRKPLHKETVFGRVNLRNIKNISIKEALKCPDQIVDKKVKKHFIKLLNEKQSIDAILKNLKSDNNQFFNKSVAKVDIYAFDNDFSASRVAIDDSFTSTVIEKITDSGIRAILNRHLAKYNEEVDGKIKEHPEIAFSPDGIDEMNKNIISLNEGKLHKPIYKARKFEPIGNKFPVGYRGVNNQKYVEAAKGTNLYFAIYIDNEGKRDYESVPLNIVVERLKQKLIPVPEFNALGNKLLFYLSPNDLVSIESDNSLKKEIYKIVSFTNNRLYAIPYFVSKCIVDKLEYTLLNKMEKTDLGISIKEKSNKVIVNRIGKIQQISINATAE